MKILFKAILKTYLKWMTKTALMIHHPKVIVVAGSINKQFTKEAVRVALTGMGASVKSNPKNFNTEIGLPLAILSLPSGYSSYRDWLPAIIGAPRALLKKDFYKYLVLELGTSDPGDMKYLLSIVKPDIAIITEITQRYLEGFSDMDKLVAEYEYLASQVPANGLVVLNGDNSRVIGIKKHLKCPVLTFAVENPADWQAGEIEKHDFGQQFIVSHKGKSILYKINSFGRHHIYAFLVALIIGSYVVQEKKE